MGCLGSKPAVVDTSLIPSLLVTDAHGKSSATLSTKRFQGFPSQETLPSRSSTSVASGFEDLAPRLQRLEDKPTKRGDSSTVYEGILDGSQRVAIKCLNKIKFEDTSADPEVAKERLEKRVKKELIRWKGVADHPRILKCIGAAYIDDTQGLISPWCDNGNAFDYLLKHPEHDKRALIAQVAEGLAFLHHQPEAIIHNDIKLENILIGDQGNALLSAFGLARKVGEQRMGLTTGQTVHKASVAAPEVLEESGADGSVKSDVYSFAILMLDLTSGRRAWSNKNEAQVIREKTLGVIPLPEDHTGLPASDPLWCLLRKCWQRDPAQRPTMAQVLEELAGLGYLEIPESEGDIVTSDGSPKQELHSS